MLKPISLIALSAIAIAGSSINQPPTQSAEELARVVNVETAGEPNNYTFSVTVDSPDTGCSRYANWWEVITPQGELIYRRVLLHSHVDEQPFTRTGGAVAIQPEDDVIVRVHMLPDGYSQHARRGSIRSGFSAVTLPENLANDLNLVEPLPKSCAF